MKFQYWSLKEKVVRIQMTLLGEVFAEDADNDDSDNEEV